MKEKILYCGIPDQLYLKLKKNSKINCYSLKVTVRMALEQYLNGNQRKYYDGKIWKNLESYNNGPHIS